MPIEQVEFNTIVTFLGMLCATVQGITGYYAAYHRKRSGLLKTNDVLSRAHGALGQTLPGRTIPGGPYAVVFAVAVPCIRGDSRNVSNVW